MEERAYTQSIVLELLSLLDEICKKYEIKYFLTEETLLGAVRNKGFLEGAHTAQVGMLLPQFFQFIKACQKELINSPYYIANCNNRKDIDELTTYLCKRSRVVLPQNRKNDEFYYDFSIDITPVIPISDSYREYRKHAKKLIAAVKIVNARKLVNKGFSPKKIYNFIIREYYASKDREAARETMKEYLAVDRKASAYVFYPNRKYIKSKIICDKKIYNDLEEITFENRTFQAIKKRHEWLSEYFGKKYTEYIPSCNVMLLRGPEEIRRVQLVQLEILKEIDRICRKYSINYFICSGTLLGAVRHGGFIPWDYDADIAMLKKDYDLFLQKCGEEIDKKKYFVRNLESEPTIHITYTQIRRNGTSFIRAGREQNKKAHHGILVDIFPLYSSPGSLIKHWMQTQICMFYKTMFWTHNGANSESNKIKRLIYKLEAKIPPSFPYRRYMSWATKYEGENTGKVSWLVAKNNPYYSDFTDKSLYGVFEDIEFEGQIFQTIKEKHRYLKAVYSEQYMLFLPKIRRINGFVPSAFDAGDLYPVESLGEIK